MELKNCSVEHFIQTIRGGLVIKVCNINSHGKPVSRSKILKDVYDSEDAKRLLKPASGSVFHNTQVKHKIPCFPVADRSLREMKSQPDILTPSVDGDSDSDLDDATTLSQLKFLTKKRKYASPDKNSKQDIPSAKAVEDESDLNEPLINLKSKRSKATRAKRRCLNPSVLSSATIKVAIKSDENLISEGPFQAGCELAPVFCVNVAVLDAEQLGSENEMHLASSAGHNEVLIPCQSIVLYDNERRSLSYVNKYDERLTSEISYDHLEDVQPLSMVFSGNEVITKFETPVSSCKESQVEIMKLEEIPDSRSSIVSCSVDGCLTNEISYNHLEDVQPLSMVFPGNEVITKFETLVSSCKESQVEITKLEEIPDSRSSIVSCSVDTDAGVSCHSNSSSVVEEIPVECSSDCQVPDMAIDGCMAPHQRSNCFLFEDNAEAGLPNKLNDSLSIPGQNYGSNQGSITTSSTKDNPIFMKDAIDDEEQLSTSSLDTIMRNKLQCHTEDELLKALDKHNSAVPLNCTKNESSVEGRTCDTADTISTPERHQLPERLFSTRKAFSPSNQERLCLAMNSVENWNDSNQHIDSECKGKLFENQTGKKPSSHRSDIQCDRQTVNHRLPGQVSQRKVIISPRRINRSQIAKGNLEGPRFSRTLPKLSTGCTSVQGCSESAVAFSQRQIHDMESIAVKLMTELKSMKDFVEQKMLFEAYRNVSLKNDVDEVKSAIKNAERTEEAAKKWMSMIARDSTRFCKIMKMMPDSTTSSKVTLPRGERKIVFADEAGEKLCHVRFFDDDTASPASSTVEQ